MPAKLSTCAILLGCACLVPKSAAAWTQYRHCWSHTRDRTCSWCKHMPVLRSSRVTAKVYEGGVGVVSVTAEVQQESQTAPRKQVKQSKSALKTAPASIKRARPVVSPPESLDAATGNASAAEGSAKPANAKKPKVRRALLTTLWTEDELVHLKTTDKKVNEVTPALFELAPDAATMAKMEVAEIQELIRQVGLAPTKAKNICNMSKMLMEEHSGVVPHTFEGLEALPGVGHKTASVVICTAFGTPTFPVDTHIHRLAQRWGLTKGKTVEQTEADLKVLLPEEKWNNYHLRFIYFGREHCPAQRHDPSLCPICSWAAVSPYDKIGCSPKKA